MTVGGRIPAPEPALRHEPDDPPYVVEVRAPRNTSVTVRLDSPDGARRSFEVVAGPEVRRIVALNDTGSYRLRVAAGERTVDHGFAVTRAQLADCNREAKRIMLAEDGELGVYDFFEQAGCTDTADGGGRIDR